MPLRRRIALCGRPGSGKTSIAEAWAERNEGVRVSFANGVKLEVAHALAAADSIGDLSRVDFVARGHLEAMADPATKDRYRTLLQLWGTEFRREQDEDYWVRVAQAVIDFYPSRPIVVDDCRFPNEYVMLKNEGFKFIVLDDGETTRAMTEAQAAHPSEQHWPHFSFDFNLPYVPGPEGQAEAIDEILASIEEMER